MGKTHRDCSSNWFNHRIGIHAVFVHFLPSLCLHCEATGAKASLLSWAAMCWTNKDCSSQMQVLNKRYQGDAPGARIWISSSSFIVCTNVASHLSLKHRAPFLHLSCWSIASRGRCCFQTQSQEPDSFEPCLNLSLLHWVFDLFWFLSPGEEQTKKMQIALHHYIFLLRASQLKKVS